jgi:hypothetical protein
MKTATCDDLVGAILAKAAHGLRRRESLRRGSRRLWRRIGWHGALEPRDGALEVRASVMSSRSVREPLTALQTGL